MVLNCLDVEVVDDAKELLMVNVEVLDEVAAGLLPTDEMLDVEVEANDVGDVVSPLDAMRPAGSISRCTRMCDD